MVTLLRSIKVTRTMTLGRLRRACVGWCHREGFTTVTARLPNDLKLHSHTTYSALLLQLVLPWVDVYGLIWGYINSSPISVLSSSVPLASRKQAPPISPSAYSNSSTRSKSTVKNSHPNNSWNP